MEIKECPYTDHKCGWHAQCIKCPIHRLSKCDTCGEQFNCFKGQHWGKDEKCKMYWRTFEKNA